MAFFNFTLEFFQIADTRSAHEDTDFVSFTVCVSGGTPTTLVKSMGDVNNGTHTVGLTIPDVTVRPTDIVVMNYLIVNAGSAGRVAVEEQLEAVAASFATGVAPAAPAFASALDADFSWLTGQLQPVFHSPCDGVVAAEQNTLAYPDLAARAASGFTQNTYHHGPASPGGCNGRPSEYIVKWGMVALTQVPDDLVGMDLQSATADLAKAGLTLRGTSGKAPRVSGSSPQPGAFEPFNTPVTLFFNQVSQ